MEDQGSRCREAGQRGGVVAEKSDHMCTENSEKMCIFMYIMHAHTHKPT